MSKKLSQTAILLILVFGAWSGIALAQDTEEQTDGQTTTAESTKEESAPQVSNRPIEQITITEERSLLSMRNEIIREEENMYRLFNDLNSTDKFDIFCKRIRTTGSFISHRDCEPVFFGDLKRESARFALAEMRQAFAGGGPPDEAILQNGLDMLESEQELRRQARGDFEDMNEEMFRIASENPEYMEALIKLAQLKGDYELARQLKLAR